MNKKEIKISFELSDVSNKCFRQIRNTTSVVEYTFNAIHNNENEKFSPLQVDALPLRIEDPDDLNNKTPTKERALDWILKKAFEEFIMGLTESLIEAHIVLMSLSFANKTKTKSFTIEEINQEFEKIKKRPLSLHFPILIDEIESELKFPLQFVDEVKSINQLRNCLVHDNGIVSEKRINDKENNLLRLKFVELLVLAEKDGQTIEVKLQDKIDGFVTNKMEAQFRKSEVTFKQGEHVIISQNLFNNISFTCVHFAQVLFEIMPKSHV